MSRTFLIEAGDSDTRDFLTLCVKAAGYRVVCGTDTAESPCAAIFSPENARLAGQTKAKWPDCRIIFLGGTAKEGETLDVPLMPQQLARILDKHGQYLPEDCALNEKTGILTVRDKDIELTLNEQELLKYFAHNPNRAFSNEELALEVFGADVKDVHTLAGETAASLAHKLEGASGIWALKHLWGVGYKFEIMI